MAQHRGWHSRGYLPHFDRAGLVQFITFRLADSLPQTKQGSQYVSSVESYYEHENGLDRGYGECVLRRREVADFAQSALHYHDGQRYSLLAWVIMPNHLHCIIEQFEGWPLGKLVSNWKGVTSKMINRHLGTNGAVWARDYYDRFIRNADHFEELVDYVHQNPVKAGLVAIPEMWEWSSASFRIELPHGKIVGADGSL